MIYENFSDVSRTKAYFAGSTLELSTMNVKVLQGLTNIDTWIDRPGYADGNRLSFGLGGMLGGSGDKLEISPTSPTSKMTFSASNLESSASYSFYDTSGNLLSTLDFAGQKSGYTVSYTAPEGVEIGKVVASTNVMGFTGHLDNFEFEGPQALAAQDSTVENTAADQDAGTYYASTGNDTLNLTAQDQIIALAAQPNDINISKSIDLTGAGDNTLQLSLDDVLNSGESNLFFNSGTIQMMVNGDAGDSVDLQGLLSAEDPGTWTTQGYAVVGGQSYEVYSHSSLAADLLVQEGVTTNLVV